MCTHPIIMRNPAKNRYGGMEYIKVPCRNCPECARAMQSDFTVRCIALWNSLPPFYYAYFCTLTFRNEDLPRTNIYTLSDDGKYYHTVASNIPCFNHQIYKRFRKNFTESLTDMCGYKPYILTTCEYGEKRKRPHYHCIIFTPFYSQWQDFKTFIERFWHYGFTMDKRIACVDGVSYSRSFHNAIEYVTKYVCKYNQWQPIYIKRPDKYVTDYPPSDVKPRVFTSNGFGAALESVLTEQNYELNNIVLGIKDDTQDITKSYSLPAYYRRRKHITTHVISQIVDKRYWYDYLSNRLNRGMAVYPYIDKLLKRPKVLRKVVTERSAKYCQYLFNDFKKSLRQKLFEYDHLIKNNPDFKCFILEKFGDCTISFTSLYNKICNIYLERCVFSFSRSLSLPIPYRNMVENQTKTHYMLLKGLNTRHFRHWFFEQLQWEHDHSLPFHDSAALPAIYFKTLKHVPYSMLPSDYYKLEYMEDYCRKFRIKQYKIKESIDKAWLDIHVKPYLKSA